MLHDPCILTCALRFDGDRYLESAGESSERNVEAFVSTLTFPPELLQNLAIFYSLQRYLGKWGGEYDLSTSRAARAYLRLFFHLYSVAVPARFQNLEYCREWACTFAPHLKSHLARLRRTWKRQVKMEAEIQRFGGSLSSSGALLLENSSKIQKEFFFPHLFTWRPTVAHGATEAECNHARRELTASELDAVRADQPSPAARLYFEFLGVGLDGGSV